MNAGQARQQHKARWPALTAERMADVKAAIGVPGALLALAREWGEPPRRLYSAAAHIRRERAKRPMAAERRCLGCGRSFRSSWIGHRICGACRERNAGVIA